MQTMAQSDPNAAATATKDKITCHVLDTSKGVPARGMRVKLELSQAPAPAPLSPTQHGHGHADATTVTKVFESQTDDDGRVNTWLPYSSSNASGEVPVYTLEDVLGSLRGSTRWTLRFDTAAYFGGEDRTFFPEVAVVFRVDEGQHYHVPLLLAPYSYSTYRGS